MPNANSAGMVSARWKKAASKTAKHGQTLREEGGMGWMARVRVVKRGNRHWEETPPA